MRAFYKASIACCIDQGIVDGVAASGVGTTTERGTIDNICTIYAMTAQETEHTDAMSLDELIRLL